MVAFSFDASQHAPRFEMPNGLSEGKHPVVIVASDFKPMKNEPNGMRLILKLEAIDGPDKGRTQELGLNIHHPSKPNSEKAGRDQLSAVCHVIGMPMGFGQATDEMHNKPFVVDVALQAGQDKFTQVTAVYDMNGNKPGQGAPVAAQQQTFAAPATQAVPQPMQQAPVPQQQPWTGGAQPAGAGPAAAPPPPWKR